MRMPLYVEAPQAAAGWEEPLPIDPACTRCELHAKADGKPCMRPEGRPGGLLVVAEYPTRADAATGRPFSGAAGKHLRSLVAQWWPGPVAFDHGLRCPPGKPDALKDKHADACRAYTAQVLREVDPQRVVVLGGWAALSVLGRKPPLHALRRGVGWWLDDATYPAPSAWRPVYMLAPHAVALRNRFLAKQFEDDLKWALTAPVPTSRALRHYQTIADAGAAWCAEQALRAAGAFAFDTETSGVLHDRDFRVECLTAWVPGDDVGWTWDRAAIEDAARRAPLVALLRDAAVRKHGHNLKYDALAVWNDPLLRADITAAMDGDTRLWRKLLDGEVDARLEVAAEQVGMGGHKAEAQAAVKAVQADLAKLAAEPHQPPLKPLKNGLARTRPPYVPKVIREHVPRAILDKLNAGPGVAVPAETIQYAYRYVDPVVRARYNARDAYATALLVEHLGPRVAAKPNLARLYDEVQRPAMRALTRMERVGIGASIHAVNNFEAYLEAKLVPVRARLKQYGDINYASPVQLADLLFNRLGLPRQQTTASGADGTGAEVLEALEGKHPIISDLFELRRLSTLQNRYATGMRTFIRDDGRLHTSYLLDGAGTGRMSSADPALQNIPRVKDADGNTEGKMARDIFVARPGYTFLEADYGQLELRVAAALSGDPVMIAMFASGVDFHFQTGRMIAPVAWGCPTPQWDSMAAGTEAQKAQVDAWRSTAKAVNFQIHYDREPQYTLARKLKCSIREAEKVVEAVRGKFKLLQRRMDDALAFARKHGGVYVYWQMAEANWRALPAIMEQGDEARGRRRNAENAAWNTPVQGSAAHFATASLLPIQREFDAEGLDAELVLTVHDSIMAEVRDDQIAEAAAIMRQVMTGWDNGPVLLEVDFKTGKAWGSTTRYDAKA